MIADYPYSGIVIDKGSFSPATIPTNRLIEYRNYKRGWLICWDMQTFWGQPQNAGAGTLSPSQSYFDIPNLVIDAWVTAALQCGIGYAALTVSTEIGFKLWSSNVSLKDVDKSGFVPTHYDYNLHRYADNNIISKFVQAFKKAGIEPGVYFNLSDDWNVTLQFGFGIGTGYPTSSMIRQDLVLFWCLEIQELMLKYGIRMFWFDGYEHLSLAEYQQIYNAVKSVDVNALVIMNCTGDAGYQQFPYDIASTEGVFIDGGNTAYQTTSRSHGGVTYYVPQEIVLAGTTSTSPQNWYNFDSRCVVQPVHPNMVLITQSQYQSYYDKTKAAGANLLCGMFPDRNGVLPQTQIDLIKNLT